METEQVIAILSEELKVIQSVTAYCRDFEKEETKSLEYRINRGKAIEQAITALKEVREYREIGTVEQVRNQKKTCPSHIRLSATMNSTEPLRISRRLKDIYVW